MDPGLSTSPNCNALQFNSIHIISCLYIIFKCMLKYNSVKTSKFYHIYCHFPTDFMTNIVIIKRYLFIFLSFLNIFFCSNSGPVPSTGGGVAHTQCKCQKGNPKIDRRAEGYGTHKMTPYGDKPLIIQKFRANPLNGKVGPKL